MATLSIQTIVNTGLSPSYAAAAGGGDDFPNDSGRLFFHAKNGAGVSQTVTINSQTNCNHGFDHDLAVAIPAGEERIIGPLPKARYNDPTDGNVKVTYSAVVTMTVAAVELP